MCSTNASSLATNSNCVHQFCAGITVQVLGFKYAFPCLLSNRLHDEVWGSFCSQGEDVRIKQSNAAKEMFNFPHLEGRKEGKHISQANQLHIPLSYCFS